MSEGARRRESKASRKREGAPSVSGRCESVCVCGCVFFIYICVCENNRVCHNLALAVEIGRRDQKEGEKQQYVQSQTRKEAQPRQRDKITEERKQAKATERRNNNSSFSIVGSNLASSSSSFLLSSTRDLCFVVGKGELGPKISR